jgi:alkylation response protein AidB-like acyl-CoA dehydrogenase
MRSGATKWVSVAREVANETLDRHAEDVDEHGRWPRESVTALAEAGLLGLTVPRKLGGAGEGP